MEEITMTKLSDDEIARKVDAALADKSDSEDKPRPKQADILIALANKNVGELFRDRDRAYADVTIDNHRETWPIRSSRFRQWIKRLYFAEHEKSPIAEAVQEAVDHMEAKALFDGQEREVHLRVAGADRRIYIDLGTADWQAIEIDEDGWRIIDEPPVRFRRPLGLEPLAIPVRGGDVRDLKRYLNVRDEDGDEGDFVLLVSWLLAALRPRGPYPALAVGGEQGTAKSTLVAILRSLVDPNMSPLRALPREDRELFIQANNAWLLAFDNVSGLPHWTSDSLCRLSTGGGFAVRQLHTDQDEILFDACRPIVLNGIADMVGRADLADRTIFLVLDPIDEKDRRSEEELWADFERDRPRIFGALLTAVAHGLRHRDTVKLSSLPRMADFARWATACETACWKIGTFKKAYDGNQREATEVLIEGDQVATAIKQFMAARIEWAGTATELKEALEIVMFGADPALRRPSKGWPADPAHLGGAVRRAAAALRKAGVYIGRGAGRKRRRITITTVKPSENTRNSASPASPDSKVNDLQRDGENGAASPQRHGVTLGDGGSATDPRSVTGSVTPNPLQTNGGDGRDDGGGDVGAISETDDGLGIPDFLDRTLQQVPPDRRPALGPPGDSLDDFK
jgi:hypothetical protein